MDGLDDVAFLADSIEGQTAGGALRHLGLFAVGLVVVLAWAFHLAGTFQPVL